MTRTPAARGRGSSPARPRRIPTRRWPRCRSSPTPGRRRCWSVTGSRGRTASSPPSTAPGTPESASRLAAVQNGNVSRLADLAVHVGANVQPDQVVSVSSEPGKEYLTRAVAEAAYKAGARFVDVQWFDPWVKRARIAHAREETLEYVPPWYGWRMKQLGEH